MPNAKVLSEKQAIVAALTEKLQNAAAGLIVDYKGITVAEDTALLADCRDNNVDYAVVKNTLLRWYDSDVAHSFRSSPVAILAALIALVCAVCALFAGWVAPHNPFDLATLELS